MGHDPTVLYPSIHHLCMMLKKERAIFCLASWSKHAANITTSEDLLEDIHQINENYSNVLHF
jgi:hypothetical protein